MLRVSGFISACFLVLALPWAQRPDAAPVRNVPLEPDAMLEQGVAQALPWAQLPDAVLELNGPQRQDGMREQRVAQALPWVQL